MCNSIKILAKAKSGELSFCEDCKSFHLIFNNLFFALNAKELKRLKAYVNDVEEMYWEHKYVCSNMRRKIPLPTTQENLVLMFNRQEVIELRTLLNFKRTKGKPAINFLSVDDIDFNLVLN